jgi:putative RecB family exonuclease
MAGQRTPRAPVTVRVPEVAAPDRPWSATAIEQFLGCPLRYWWQRIERWETPSTAALVIGRAVHSALEHLLALPPDERVPERADAYLAEALIDEFALVEGQGIDEEEVRSGSARAMAAYFATEEPARVEVAPDGLERKVRTDLAGLPFLGHIDRIAVAEPGLRVTDYKTGAPKPKYWWSYWRQQLLYAAALEDMGEPIAEIELLYLKEPRAVTRPVYPAAVSRALADLEIAHEQRDAMAVGGAWEARPGPLCRYCDFQPVCPAQRSGAPKPGSPESGDILRQRGLVQRVAETAASAPPAGDLLDVLDEEILDGGVST